MAKSTVNESETRTSDVEARDSDRQSSETRFFDGGLTGWLAASALRIMLALVGVFLLLAALGQLSGLDLFGITATAITSTIGRWLIVTAIGVVLIVAAVYGFAGIGSK